MSNQSTRVAPAPSGFVRSLATAVEVAEHEARISAEQLERCAERAHAASGRLLSDVRIERNASGPDAQHVRNVRESNGMGASAVELERALATYLVKRDHMAVLRKLLAEARAETAKTEPLLTELREAARESVFQVDGLLDLIPEDNPLSRRQAVFDTSTANGYLRGALAKVDKGGA